MTYLQLEMCHHMQLYNVSATIRLQRYLEWRMQLNLKQQTEIINHAQGLELAAPEEHIYKSTFPDVQFVSNFNTLSAAQGHLRTIRMSKPELATDLGKRIYFVNLTSSCSLIPQNSQVNCSSKHEMLTASDNTIWLQVKTRTADSVIASDKHSFPVYQN